MKTLATITLIILSSHLFSQNISSNTNEVDLMVELIDDTKLISWTTQKEVNTSSFILERKIGEQPYEIIDIVKAKGYSTIQQSYEYEDVEEFAETIIYRVSLVKMGGEIENYAVSSLSAIDELLTEERIADK